ncbi:hypothetical protein ACWD42_41085, partial [Streptomyces sp. NPDC002550]
MQKAASTVVQERAVKASAYDDRTELALVEGRVFIAKSRVVAAGVTRLIPSDMEWVSARAGFSACPLWRATPRELTGRTCSLAADRLIGRWLRGNPDATTTLHVLCPPAGRYKADEVQNDRRVGLVQGWCPAKWCRNPDRLAPATTSTAITVEAPRPVS